jgi:hypothetical protein
MPRTAVQHRRTLADFPFVIRRCFPERRLGERWDETGVEESSGGRPTVVFCPASARYHKQSLGRSQIKARVPAEAYPLSSLAHPR